MQTTLLLLVKIGLLVLLWFFIWMAIRAMRKDTVQAMGPTSGFGTGSGYNAGYGVAEQSAPHSSGLRNTFSRTKPPTSLRVTTGPLAGTTLDFSGYQEITIGRSSACTLQLDDDFSSGTHAQLIRRGHDWYLEDQDSRNGTWINGQRIDQPERMASGMEIRIGQTQVRMER